MRGFLQRHPALSLRMANNIKRSRARLSSDDVETFFDNFEATVEGIPPENVFNYDETNLTNDQGTKKALFRRGTKYAERVMDATKSSISVEFCASAKGVLLPPYVIYQGKNCYPEWCEDGIDGSVYNSSKSGWFDMCSFTDWFEKIFLPHARRLEGKKLLIGDNVSSHISNRVLELCAANNIEFVFLPANSTDKLQPLDVGFFGPMKRKWREFLRMKKADDPDFNGVNKVKFPSHLKHLVGLLKPDDLMPAAFEKCGLVPLNPQKVLERLPTVQNTKDMCTDLDQVVLQRLEANRYGKGVKAGRPKGKKIPAGKSHTPGKRSLSVPEDEIDDPPTPEDKEAAADAVEPEKELDELPSPSRYTKDRSCSPQPGCSWYPDPPRPQLENMSKQKKQKHLASAPATLKSVYEGQWFLAIVSKNQVNVTEGYTKLEYMKIKGMNMFVWDKDDVLDTRNQDIIMTNVQPIPMNNRGYLGLNKADYAKIIKKMTSKSFMVVLYSFSIIFFNLILHKH